MIVCPNLYSGAQQGNAAGSNMNCGLQQQYDEVGRHSVFSGLTVDPHWLRQPMHNIVKQEPKDDTEYGAYDDKTPNFQSPLTPPGLPAVNNYGFPTPPQPDYASASSPQQVQHADYLTQQHQQLQQQQQQQQQMQQESGAVARPPSNQSVQSPQEKASPPAQMTPPSPSQELHPHQVLNQPDKHDQQDTSQSSNSENEYYENGDSLKRLQMALQRTGMIVSEEKLQCPMCDFFCNVRSQFNEHLLSHETKCTVCDFNAETGEKLREHMRTAHENMFEEDMWTEEEPGLNTPKVNSQGKVKTFRCKQCEFSAVTKLEFWEHSRSHIKQERLLTCPKCPFVTEYKHHLEYHLRNHFGSKPFKCDKCSYSCVNKSMLNSHLKSHSNVYQFRCSDCTYATKYCHSLKLHLRKYGHNPAMVLNPDGSPNPLPIVDVYGTRRGPKQKSKSAPQPEKQSPQQHLPQTHHQQQQQLPVPVFNPYSLLPAQMPYYNILNGFAPFAFQHDMKLEEKNNNVEKAFDEEHCDEDADADREEKKPLDLTCPDAESGQAMGGGGGGGSETPIFKNRRKGKAFKLERIAMRLQQHSDEESPAPVTPLAPPPATVPAPAPATSLPAAAPAPSTALSTTPTKWDSNVSGKTCQVKSCEADSEQQKSERQADKQDQYNCSYCDISFKDIVMYTMHMGYHGYQDPFTCNMCGQQTSDKVAFFLHIARTSHS